ncbi:DNA topoisomerase [Helicobacter pylori]|uniref:DNA topoisomerase n=1 Tax=Helicobacter pylori TaxID=210 RepID=UPI003521BFD4
MLFSRSNTNLYQSFLGRIASDQVVGFALTSYLRKSLNLSELSAGRVQTPALALICQRDQEIRDFDKLDAEEKVEYQIQASIVCNEKEVIIKHVRANEKNELVDFKFKDKNEASQFLKDLKDGLGSMSVLVSLKESLSNKEPKKPFTTSKLLSQASKSLKIPTKEIAQLAQKLFEAGLITYHRTDSEFLSPEYLKEHEAFFEPIYPSVYQYREYKAGKNSQAEAHEAIRITHPHALKDLEKVCSDAKISEELVLKLYQLIYANTICSQSRNALYNQYDCIFKIKSESFKLSFKLLKEKGFLEIEELIQGKEEPNKEEQENEIENFSLKENDSVPLKEVFIKKIEKPSPKPYKESAFIPLLESEGIGRPSTYASFLDLLLKRKYISIDAKTNAITPTSQGLEVISFFKKDKEVDFIALTSKDKSKLGSTTKQFEECLDLIMRGEASYEKFMSEVISKLKSTAKFYQTQYTDNNMPTDKQLELIDKICKDKGIGRPSTYASYLPTLVKREYISISQDKKHIITPTHKGKRVVEVFENAYQFIIDLTYTKQMEEMLDEIVENKSSYVDFISNLNSKCPKIEKLERNDDEIKPSSEGQITYIENILRDLQLNLSEEFKNYKEDNRVAKAFLDRYIKEHEFFKKNNKKASSSNNDENRPATPKQINFAEILAKKHNVKLPKGFKYSMKVCGDFINEYHKK